MNLTLELLEPRLLLDGAVLITQFASEGAVVSLYDVTDSGLTADAVQVSFGTGGAVKSITVAAEPGIENLGIVVSGASSVGSVKASGALAFIASTAAIKSISLNGGLAGYDLNGESLGGIAFDADVDADGVTDDPMAVYCEESVRSIKLNGDLDGDVWIEGGGGIALTKLDVKGGGVNGDIYIGGAAGKISIKSTDPSDPAFGDGCTITITGTDDGGYSLRALTLSGDLAGSLITAGGVRQLQIKGGDLCGMLDLEGDLDKLDIKASGGEGGDVLEGACVAVNGLLGKLNVGGSILGGKEPKNLAQFLAMFIGDVKIRNRVKHCRILSGIDLGIDWDIGGEGDAADTFCQGLIDKISIGGDVDDSIIGAGLVPHDGEFNLAWLADHCAFIDGSHIGSIQIGGDLSWDLGDFSCGIGADSIGSLKLSNWLSYLLVFLNELL